MAASKRMANWDLLRSLSMLLVVVCHSARYLPPVCGVDVAPALERLALVCDPVFFALSGFFAIRPLRQGYGRYLSHKAKTIVVPLLVYATLAYAAFCLTGSEVLGVDTYLTWVWQTMGAQYWFVPALIPCLMVAPLLYALFSNLDRRQTRLALSITVALSLWGLAGQLVEMTFPSATTEGLLGIANHLFPASTLLGSYLPYFCLGYLAERVPELYGERGARAICVLGWVAWPCVALLALLGFEPHNPDYSWVVTTIAVFCLFAKICVRGRRTSAVITWVARHSYGIYLLQAGVIHFVFAAATGAGLLDTSRGEPVCVMAWVACTLACYLVSLAAAALLDATVVRLAQAGYERIEGALAHHK